MSTETNANDRRDESDADRTLDSWDDIEPGDTVRYVGENDTNLGLDGVLTFRFVSMYETTVLFEDRFNGRRPLNFDEWPAEDFVPVATEIEA